MLKKKQLTNKALADVNHTDNPGGVLAQIAMLSERITNLQAHLKTNKKDKHSNRGLLQMVADRRRHIKYAKRTKTAEEVKEVLDKYGLKN